MSRTNNQRPPLGWELQINVPDYGPEVFDPMEGAYDIYYSPEYTKDGSVKVQANWTAEEGFLFFVTDASHGSIDLPSPLAARKLADLLYEIAAEAEQS